MRRSPDRLEAGATLVELMISLLLFSILAAGAFVAMSSQQESSRKLGRSANMLDTTRTALNTLALQLATIKSGMPFGVAVLNDTADVVSSPAPPYVTCGSYAAGARPYQTDPGIALPTGTLVPVIVLRNNYSDAARGLVVTDSIRILRPDGRAWGGLTTPVAPADGNIDLNTPTALPLIADNMALVTNYEHAMLFRIQSVTPASCASGTGTFCVAKKTPTGTYTAPNFATGNTLLQARWQVYQVSTFLGINALTVTDESQLGAGGRPQVEPVAMNIVNMQIALGIDGLNGGTPNGILESTEWAYGGSGTTLTDPCALGNLRAIRVTLVARARQADEGAKVGVPQIEDRPARAPDGFYRIIETITVAVRQ